MMAIPAIPIDVVALAMLASGTTNAITLTQGCAGYIPVGFNFGITKQDNLQRIAEFRNLILGLYHQVVVRHADTLVISLAYVNRLPTMASTNDASRSRLWRFTLPSFSLKVNSSMYRERCLGLA